MARLLDNLYRWAFGLPTCKPGACFCRRGCARMVEDPAEDTQ